MSLGPLFPVSAVTHLGPGCNIFHQILWTRHKRHAQGPLGAGRSEELKEPRVTTFPCFMVFYTDNVYSKFALGKTEWLTLIL